MRFGSERFLGFRFPMHPPDLARRFRRGFYPVAQDFLVGMGGVAGQVVDVGSGRGAAFHWERHFCRFSPKLFPGTGISPIFSPGMWP